MDKDDISRKYELKRNQLGPVSGDHGSLRHLV
jgi:hypothetical protein